MRTLLRRLAALLALLALTTVVVEQGWAAACAEADTPPAHATHHADATDPDGRPGPDQRDAAPCPMAAGSGLACGAAALPVAVAPVPPGPEAGSPAHPAADATPGSLALSSLFRPPRR